MTQIEPIIPSGFNVLVEIIEHEEKTKGGIILPNNDQKEIRSELTRVITSGHNAFVDCFGDKAPPPSSYPYALIKRNTGDLLYIGKKLHRLVSSDNITGFLTKEAAINYCHDNFNFQLTNLENQND